MHGFHQLHSTKFTKILAIDLGKFNSVVCLYDPATTQHSFVTIQTTPQAVHDLLVQHARPRKGAQKRGRAGSVSTLPFNGVAASHHASPPADAARAFALVGCGRAMRRRGCV